MTNGMERAEDQIMLRNSGASFGNKVKDASVSRPGCERIIFEVSCVAAEGVVLLSPSKAFPVVLIESTMALFAEGANMMAESFGLVCSIGLTMATFARREEGGTDTTDEVC